MPEAPTPAPFVLVGCGSVGRGVFHQSTLTPAARCVAIADLDLERARALAGDDRPYRVVASPGQASDAIRAGMLAVTDDASVIAAAEGAAVYFDCSTALDAAPPAIESALASGKHVVMMNAEADATFGPWFHHEARRHGVVYTSSDGDQPAVIARLVAEIESYGLRFVMGGNVKGFLDTYTDPVKIRPEAEKRYLDPQMCSSYTDGTKLNVEMALTANGLGCDPAVPGMHGPRMAEVTGLFSHFDLASLWDPSRPPLVDYVLGAKPRGGVFVVGWTDDPYQQKMLAWFPPDLGPGPFYVFPRPYHLVHLETMRTVLDAAAGRAVLAPRYGMRTETVAYAKRDLPAGSRLDGPGGFAAYGRIESRSTTGGTGFPICLSQGVRTTRTLARDERIAWSDVIESDVPPTAFSTWGKAVRAVPELPSPVPGTPGDAPTGGRS